ncbi:MAG: leucine-rich repeat protein [Bacteroidaceae bacterium]|nr:leucine-rich repeat protein [Bacteroidaceae bacterium]
MSSVSKPRVRHNRHKQGLNLTLEKLSADFRYIKNATISNNGDIGTYAFSGCTSLENATISNNGDIGDSAFRGCTSLATVSINNKDSIGDYAFYGCSSLKEVVLPDSVTSLGNYSFQSCSALESVVIGNGVKKIGNWAFSHCTNLNYFAFGRNMKTIGEEAFSDCNNLTTIISLATTPPVCGSQALDDINKWECVLYVPGNYISTYQTAEQWKDFFFIENAPISFTADVDGDGSIDVADVTEVVDAILNGEGENENTPFEIIFDAWTSTNTANSSTSQKSYTLEVTEGSVLTFDWKVSSENNYDWLIITLDGTQILKKSGSYSGSYEHTFNTAGTHTLVVKYTKDGSSSSGSDQGKIHNIKLTGTANDTTDVNADVDGDGSIDIADVTALVEIILGTKQ